MPPQNPFHLTLRNIFRKLPVFFIAAVACWLLYSLDSFKKRHSDGRSGKIIVNNDYLDKLALTLNDGTDAGRQASSNFSADRPLKSLSERTGEEEELRINKDTRGEAAPADKGQQVLASPRRVLKDTVMFHSFSTPEEMIEAVRARLEARRDEDIKSYAVISDALVKAMAVGLREPAPPEQKKGSGKLRTAGAHVTAEATATAVPDAGVKFERMAKEVAALNAEARKAVDIHWKIADAKFGLVAGLNRERLKQSFASDAGKRRGLFYSAFEPILDEKRGAYVIFQMLWLGLAGVLLFCMIYVVTRALRVLFFTEGEGVIIDQAKVLLTAARETPIRELPRASLLTIAALGTATAVAAGGIAAASPTARVLAAPPAAEEEAPSKKNSTAELPVKPPPSGGQTDLSPLVTSLDDVGLKMTGLMQSLGEREQSGVTQTNNHLQNIGQILTSRLTNNNVEGGRLSADVTIPNLDAYARQLGEFSGRVAGFTGEMKGYSATLNGIAAKVEACCATKQQPDPAATDMEDLKTRVRELQETLQRIERQLIPPAPAAIPDPPPYREGTLSRLNPFNGSGQYRVTQRSYEVLKVYFGKAGEDGNGKKILGALYDLMNREPLGESKFIEAIIGKMSGDDSKAKRKGIEPWRRVILRETRVS